MALGKEPTPGNIIAEAFFKSFFSEDTLTSQPIDVIAFEMLKRFETL
tara:strand:+ start:1742 stop:1882 length:141 start_codon:yes stop_codon:yes gene_type:complete